MSACGTRTPCTGRSSFFFNIIDFTKEIIMRIAGRTLRPSSLQERRLFVSLGTDSVRVPRGMNPYVVARSARRLSMNEPAELVMLRSLVRKTKRTPIFEPSPGIDVPEPVGLGA